VRYRPEVATNVRWQQQVGDGLSAQGHGEEAVQRARDTLGQWMRYRERTMEGNRSTTTSRLMYVGITRARTTLAVSTLRRRKRGRETVAGVPSRFIAEMKLHEATTKEDPRERLKKLREQLAAKAAAADPQRL